MKDTLHLGHPETQGSTVSSQSSRSHPRFWDWAVRLFRVLLPFIVVGGLFYVLLRAVDPSNLVLSAKGFNWVYLLPLVGSYVLYLLLRAARWHFLMRPLDAPNSFVDSLLLFTAAQAALLAPAGQLFLPILQKGQHGTLVRRCVATVLVQELIFGVLVLPAAIPGAFNYALGGWFLAGAFLLSPVVGFIILHEGTANLGIICVGFVPLLRRHIPSFRELREHIVLLVNTRETVLGSLLDLAAIATAGTGFFIALVGLGQAHVGWTGAIGSYALAAAVSALSALPGGLGANENVSTVSLSHMGLPPGPAAAATLIFRVATLVVGTLMGCVVLLLFRKRFGVERTFGELWLSLGRVKAGAAL